MDALHWMQFCKLPHIKKLSLSEQIRQYNMHVESIIQQNILYEQYRMSELEKLQLVIATSGGGGSTPTPTPSVTTYNFDITADWSLTTPQVVDEASFIEFLESGEDNDGGVNGLTDVVVTDFLLEDGRLRCNLSANSDNDGIYLAMIDITDFKGLGNITNLTFLYLNNNQLTEFNPTTELPITLSEIDLGSNLFENSGYEASELWANQLSVIPDRGAIYFQSNIDSVSGTNLETILISKGWTVTA